MTKTPLVLALVLLLALLPAACSGSDDDDAGSAAADTAAAGSAQSEDAASGGGDSGGGEAVPASQQSVPGVAPKVIQTASLSLSVAKGDYEEAVTDARNVAARLGGFVVSSETNRARASQPLRGSLTIRVPSERYAAAMAAVSGLGRIESESEGSEDVSAEYVDLQSRARHLEAVERQLLELLDRADTVAAALAVQSQLSQTQLELEQTRGRIRYLDNQTSYATISLELRERGVVQAAGGDWGIVDAWRDGARAFLRVVAGTFVVVATVAPLLVLALLGWAGLRFVRRRRAAPAPS
jgi:uncharacterized protein DUF4349